MQNQAVRFVTGNYNLETGSIAKTLEQSKVGNSQADAEGSTLILPYKSLKGQTRIPVVDLNVPSRHIKDQHPQFFQLPYARIDIYKHGFFPETIRDLDSLPASTLLSIECFEDCIS